MEEGWVGEMAGLEGEFEGQGGKGLGADRDVYFLRNAILRPSKDLYRCVFVSKRNAATQARLWSKIHVVCHLIVPSPHMAIL